MGYSVVDRNGPENRIAKTEGLGIFLIVHDVHDVMKLYDRASVMRNGLQVVTVDVKDVTNDELLAMIIRGKHPDQDT